MNSSKMKRIPALLIIACLIIGNAISYNATPAFCQEETSTMSNHEGLLRSLQEAHKSLLSDIGELKKSLSEAEAEKKKSHPFIENLKLKRASYSSPLLLSEPGVEELRIAKAGVFNDTKEIERRLNHLSELFEQVNNAESESLERTSLYNEQIARLKEDKENLPDAGAVLGKLRQIIDSLNEQRDLLNRVQATYGAQIGEYEELLDSYRNLYAKLEGALAKQHKSELTRKSSSAFTDFNWQRVRFEAERAITKIRSILTKHFWMQEGRNISEFNLYLLGTFLVLLLISLSLLRRLRKFCAALKQKPALQQYPWICLGLELIRRSILMMGTLIFLYVYGEARQLYSLLPIYSYALDILLTWLFTSWALNFLKLSYEAKGLTPGKLFHRLRIAIYVIRLFVITYAALDWAIDTESWMLALWRVLFSACLFLLSLRIAKLIWEGAPGENSTDSRLPATVRKIIITAMYVIAGGGFFIELVGYGNFALFWLASWGRLLMVLLWGGLLFVILRRLDHDAEGGATVDDTKSKRISRPVRWLLIRVGQLSWILAMCVGILVAWGAGGPLIIHFFNFLNRPFEIGSFRLSLQSVGYALLILLITHALASIWRPFFYNKILDRSGMERGMQASITTITIYMVWFLGILMALNTIGVSATSLAVLFGALGIGLGFGLQNIFSNFISGLILLFERPVQVGDAVEIEGTWGLIQNINVRATVVQTYDNASLIIPNSDFISKQVTNWSFKDPRVRINVEVGVAYGSDTQLVKDILLEVAHNNPNVMKYPQPDVLFTDFGDSALMFKLRVWTNITSMLSSATAIRFEIDRLFRERGVEIPFPQRDIHVRSMVEKPKPEPEDKE